MDKWIQILLFSVIFGIVGFLLGSRQGSCDCKHEHPHGKQISKEIVMTDGGEEEKMKVIVKELEMADFEGDTTVVVDGMTINMSKKDGEIEVNVEADGEADAEGYVKKEVRVMKKAE